MAETPPPLSENSIKSVFWCLPLSVISTLILNTYTAKRYWLSFTKMWIHITCLMSRDFFTYSEHKIYLIYPPLDLRFHIIPKTNYVLILIMIGFFSTMLRQRQRDKENLFWICSQFHCFANFALNSHLDLAFLWFWCWTYFFWLRSS